jgi:hypothetical protein
MGKLERDFQAKLIKELRVLFPGCIIQKSNAEHLSGVPDLTILFGDKWATLECKARSDSEERPGQRYYVELMDRMSFSAFIYPENKEQVLDGLQRALRPRRQTRVSQRE